MRHKQKENHIREQLKKIRHIERMTNQRYLRDIQHHSVVKPKSPDVESFHPPWRPLINQYHTDMKFVYLIPLHGGIWNLCLTLNGWFLFFNTTLSVHHYPPSFQKMDYCIQLWSLKKTSTA